MMKTKIGIFMLAVSLAAYGQGRSNGAAGAHMGGAPSGSMGSSMGSMHDAGNSHGGSLHGSDMGKQFPDAVFSNNTQLSSRLQKLLPAGTSLKDACNGFKNVGQCIAAIHVAHNLPGVSFADLKTKMTTGSESLGHAIHDLKPDANAKSEAKKAEKQANDDLASS